MVHREIVQTEEFKEKYPLLAAYVSPVRKPEREVLGRDYEKVLVKAGLARPELSNILLLAQAGAGKSTLVEAVAEEDTSALYLEVDVALMISDLRMQEELASIIKKIFDEAEAFVDDEKIELVLFMDEFHQLVQISKSAVEAIKPVLAQSGTRGIKVIAATTYEEFHQWIAPNQPLMERLQRVNLSPPDKKTTISILEGAAQRYEVSHLVRDPQLYELIYEYTNRYQPSSEQPRKSILLLDAMLGWHFETGRAMDVSLLHDVLEQSTGIKVDFRVDATRIKEQLDSKVFAQDLATKQVERRLHLTVADLQDQTKPKSSMLFSGPTGVGKEAADYTPVPVYTEDGLVAWKKHGDLVVGDRVFQRDGSVQDVLGVFPQGKKDIYRVTTWDDRTLDVGGPHLWLVYTAKMRRNKHSGKPVQPKIMTTLEMIEKGVVHTYSGDNREHLKFFIPANGAVQWPERKLEIDPYVLGVFIGNGSLRESPLTLSSDDAAVVSRVGEALGVTPKKTSAYNYSWVFPTGEKWGTGDRRIQTADFLASTPALIDCYSADRRIPEQYMTASIEQRWELVRGLFDTDGTIDASTGRFNVSYSTFSKGLAEDIRSLLFSLGVSNTLNTYTRTKDDGCVLVEYHIHVKVGNEDKEQFFWLPRKRQIAAAAAEATAGRKRAKKFDMVGIKSIEKLPEQQSASCIYVSGEEHLYQAGEFIVTHNTELTKQLAHLLFGDANRHLIRFDMSEFSQHDSLDFFRNELSKAVWNTGHAIVLLDEIEKADPNIVRLLLQVLDDGRLTDMHGRTVSFLNTYIIMTTNAASEIYRVISQYDEDDEGSGVPMEDRMKEIRRSLTETGDFPPELLGRIDTIVPFQPLSEATMVKVVTAAMKKKVLEIWEKHRVKVGVDKKVITYLIEDRTATDSNEGGARQVLNKMAEEFTTELAKYINTYPTEKDVWVDVAGEMRAGDKTALKSRARITVGKRIAR